MLKKSEIIGLKKALIKQIVHIKTEDKANSFQIIMAKSNVRILNMVLALPTDDGLKEVGEA